MGNRRLFFNIAFFLALVLAFPAFAEDLPPLELKAIYQLDFSNMALGKLGIEAEQTANHYSMVADIKLTGIAKLLTKHSSHTTVDATGTRFHYTHIIYDTHYQTKGKKRAVKLIYENGLLKNETVVPPENSEKRKPVSRTLKRNSVDPLSLNIEMRRLLWDALQKNKQSFTLKVYDGRRLTEINATIAGKKNIDYYDQNAYPVITLLVRRKLLAGFTKSELESFNPKEPTLKIHYSDDDRMIPIKLEVPFLFGNLSATLAKECRTGESCLLGIKE